MKNLIRGILSIFTPEYKPYLVERARKILKQDGLKRDMDNIKKDYYNAAKKIKHTYFKQGGSYDRIFGRCKRN